MKTIIRTLILLLGLSLFACTPKERPVPPGNGENPVYMNGSTQYTILSHENTILRDSLSKSIAVGKAEMTTSAGTVVHYLSYDKWGSYHGEKGKRPVRILYADFNSSCVAWNEKALKNANDGIRVFVVSENDFSCLQDHEDFQYYIFTNFE